MSANPQKNESINLKVHGFSFDSSKLKKNEMEAHFRPTPFKVPTNIFRTANISGLLPPQKLEIFILEPFASS